MLITFLLQNYLTQLSGWSRERTFVDLSVFEAAVTVALTGDADHALKVLYGKLSKEDFLISLGTNERFEEITDLDDLEPPLALAKTEGSSTVNPDESLLSSFNKGLVEHLKKTNFSHPTIEKDGLEIVKENRKRPFDIAQSILEVVHKNDLATKKVERSQDGLEG